MSGGADFFCALVSSGGVVCWGNNSRGQLGTGDVLSRLAPPDVTVLSNVTAVSAGEAFVCALVPVGGVWCWGDNVYGQLGRGEGASQEPGLWPALISVEIPGVVGLAAGARHACAFSAGLSSTVHCWGSNIHGELGLGFTSVPISVPRRVFVNLPMHVAAVVLGLAAGDSFTCANVELHSVPVDPRTAESSDRESSANRNNDTEAPASGGQSVQSINATVGVLCWGAGGYGALGNGDQLGRDVLEPQKNFVLNTSVVAMSAGNHHMCAVTAAGKVVTWGYNDHGQRGTSNYVGYLRPRVVLSGGASFVSCGAGWSCVVLHNKTELCWGANYAGQAGNGDPSGADVLTPPITPAVLNVMMDPSESVVEGPWVPVSTGSQASAACAIVAPSGELVCWGKNRDGQLGRGFASTHDCECERTPGGFLFPTSSVSVTPSASPSPSPSIPPSKVRYTDVVVGMGFTCALTSGGDVVCWGTDDLGQLGDGGFPGPDVVSPPNIATLVNVTTLAAGKAFVCALTWFGDVYCWGDNSMGQCGTGSLSALQPTPVLILSGAHLVGAGATHACAALLDSLMCWGSNQQGELGLGYVGDPVPVPTSTVVIPALADVVSVTGGDRYTCAVAGEVNSTYHVACWGGNEYGQLGLGMESSTGATGEVGAGDPETEDGTIPGSGVSWVLAAEAVQISAGNHHVCALQGGVMYTWGSNNHGQVSSLVLHGGVSCLPLRACLPGV